MSWLIAVGGPLLGIAAVVALVVAHEHGAALRRSKVPLMGRVPRAPHAGRRASTALLEDYLAEDREASPMELRHRRNGLLLQANRSSTWVLQDYLEDREAALAALAAVARPVRPAPTSLPVRPELDEARGRVLRQAQDERRRRESRGEREGRESRHDRAPRPTRLVPLTARAEIAIG